MTVVSENEHTEESIKAELETLYVAAGYINAERGNMEIVMHLIGAVIADLEGIVEDRPRPSLRLVRNTADSNSA
ncbi:MAG: hypothetical protein KAJ11_01470 [Alphaproteobacteria bacterium]|nr:hypothetical protein [Alphaproteobacteria bacterium]MCK5620930.1 hypothetical protein [Alphaproteobacteria bacterium]